MRINSEKLFEFVNNLGTNEKVKFKVYSDDNYVTVINWDGENFNWEPGTFTSGMFFDPLTDFEEIEEDNKIKQEENYVDFVNLKDDEKFDYLYEMITRIIDYINKEPKYTGSTYTIKRDED